MDTEGSTNDNIDELELMDDPDFEAFYERLWKVAVSTANPMLENFRDKVPPPEQSVAMQLELYKDRWDPEHQKLALIEAADYGEEMIRRHEQDIEEMRLALAALRQPRSALLRSRIGLAPTVDSPSEE